MLPHVKDSCILRIWILKSAWKSVRIQSQQLGNRGDNVGVNAVKVKDPKPYQKNKSKSMKTAKSPGKSSEKSYGRCVKYMSTENVQHLVKCVENVA